MTEIPETLESRLRSPRSKEAYLRIIEDLGGDVSLVSIRRWWTKLRRKGLSDNSISVYAAYVRSYLRSLADDGDVQAEESLQWLRRIRVRRHTPSIIGKEPLTAEEIDRLAKTLPERARLALDVLRKSGLRATTLLELRPENVVHHNGKWWLVFRTKGERLVEIPSTEDLCRKLLDTPYPWFPWRSRHSFYQALVKTARRVLGRRVTPHDLRRAFATRVYEESGHDLELTRRMMGHASVNTTSRYIVLDHQTMQDVVDKL